MKGNDIMANNRSFALKDTTINKIRIRKNLTIEEIANAMNKPRGTVGRWFSGVAVPRHNNAIILADILDMEYEYLLDAVKNDHERWKKHEEGCKAKLKGEPNKEKICESEKTSPKNLRASESLSREEIKEILEYSKPEIHTCEDEPIEENNFLVIRIDIPANDPNLDLNKINKNIRDFIQKTTEKCKFSTYSIDFSSEIRK